MLKYLKCTEFRVLYSWKHLTAPNIKKNNSQFFFKFIAYVNKTVKCKYKKKVGLGRVYHITRFLRISRCVFSYFYPLLGTP